MFQDTISMKCDLLETPWSQVSIKLKNYSSSSTSIVTVVIETFLCGPLSKSSKAFYFLLTGTVSSGLGVHPQSVTEYIVLMAT